MYGVVSLNANGSPDNSFSQDGIYTVKVGSNDNAAAVALQSDGKIVVGGKSYDKGKYNFSCIRLMPGGLPDSSFDADGKLIVSVSTATEDVYDLAIQPNGKIILAGSSNLYTLSDYAALRLHKDGRPDSSFGINSKLIVDVNGNTDVAKSILIQPDNKIILAGSSYSSSTTVHFSMIRLNNNGSPDNSFGKKGKVVDIKMPTNSIGQCAALQPDGNILIAGYNNAPTTGTSFIAMRFLGSAVNVDLLAGTTESLKSNSDLKARLIIPNLLRKNQQWQISGLPADNKIVLTDQHGRSLLNISNYRNNQSLNGLATGIYFYSIFTRQSNGKTEVYKGKILLTE